MKRRNFLRSLVAIAVAPKALELVAKLAPAPPTSLVGFLDLQYSRSIHGLSSSSYAQWNSPVTVRRVSTRFDIDAVHDAAIRRQLEKQARAAIEATSRRLLDQMMGLYG